MNTPTISIISPVFNGASTLRQCIESVAAQTYINKEHIFMDGMSTDHSLDIIREYTQQYPHIRCFSQKDKGIYDAMNMGLEKAGGEWIYFMGTDDILHDENVLNAFFLNQDLQNVDVIYGAIKHAGSKIKHFFEFDKPRLSWMNMSHQALFTHINVFKKIGYFNLKYKAYADYEFNLRWFGNDEIRLVNKDIIIAVYNEEGFSAEFFDKCFHRNKLVLLDKYLGFNKNWSEFPDTAIKTARIQVRNKDFYYGFKSALEATKATGKLYYLRSIINEIFKVIFNLK